MPTYAHDTDAGMDVYALDDYTIAPGETKLHPTGFKIAIPTGYELQVRPKSGRCLKTKLRIAISRNNRCRLSWWSRHHHRECRASHQRYRVWFWRKRQTDYYVNSSWRILYNLVKAKSSRSLYWVLFPRQASSRLKNWQKPVIEMEASGVRVWSEQNKTWWNSRRAGTR